MIAAIHQPNFLPYLGFFYKMLKADVFVMFTQAKFTKGGFINRNKIKTHIGSKWITVPILKTLDRVIEYTEIDKKTVWKRKHLKTFELNYSKAPFYNEVKERILDECYSYVDGYRINYISSFSWMLINHILAYCGIKKLIIGDYHIEDSETQTKSGSERLINLVSNCGADTYLSGPSGRSYLDESLFEKNGIKIIYSDFKHPVYPQLWGDFVPNLSVIDALFMKGPKALEFD